MSAKPTYDFDGAAGAHLWTYLDTTALRVTPGRPDSRGRLMADVVASVGETRLNRARMDLLSQDDRAKFHANTQARLAALNGNIPVDDAKRADWFGRLVDILPTVETTPESPGPTMTLTRLGDLLHEPEEAVDWLADGLLPSGGFSLLAAKPKVGKSTLARCLALAVARGEPFLGRTTSQGPVIYLALEEKRGEVRKHFQAMGASGEEEIYIYAATAPADALEKIRLVVEEKRPALLIIDPLFRMTRVKDSNDYAQVTAALEPLMGMARETGCHVLVVHHLGKGEHSGADAILGSTAIRAAVDTSVILKRSERYRTICSEQRYGEDFEETTLRYDPATRIVSPGGTKEREEMGRMQEAIIEWLQGQDEPQAEADIKANVKGNNRHKQTALRNLLNGGHLERVGKGTRGAPYRYSLTHFSYIQKCESENPKSDVNADGSRAYSHFETSQHGAKHESEKSEYSQDRCPTCGGDDFSELTPGGRVVCMGCLMKGNGHD
jgi:AAA domain